MRRIPTTAPASIPATTPAPLKLAARDVIPKRALKRKRHSSTEKAIEELQGIARTLGNNSGESDNEFDCFGKTITCQLKKLPEAIALQSMAYIQSYLVNQRLKANVEQRAPFTYISSASSPASSMSSFEYVGTSTPTGTYQETESDILSQAINTSLVDY